MGSVDEVARERARSTKAWADRRGGDQRRRSHAGYWRSINAGRPILAVCRYRPSGGRVRAWFCQRWPRLAARTRIPQGKIDFALQVPGLHNVRNALGAQQPASRPAVPLEGGGRRTGGFRRHPRSPACAGLGRGAVILTIRTTPIRIRCASASRAGRHAGPYQDPGARRHGQIGEQSQYHDEVGGYAKKKGVDGLFGLGEMSAVAARNFGVTPPPSSTSWRR